MYKMVIAASLCMSMLGPCVAQIPPVAMTRIETRIPPQSLAKALKQFEKLHHLQVLYFSAEIRDLRTNGASGDLTAAQTLSRLLSGTGLTYRYVDANAVSIIRVTSAVATASNALSAQGRRIASNVTPKRTAPAIHKSGDPADATRSKTRQSGPPHETHAAAALREVIVTGTHIRGIEPMSPVIDISRTDIEQSGLTTLGDVLQALPENFSGGQNPNVASANGINAGRNDGAESAVANLYGIGAGSTLTLIDGHRLASDGVFSGADLNVVPLAAVDHIQVSTSGASAIYGSDAVAGVVNIALRKNYNGVDTTGTVDVPTAGGGMEQTYSALVGRTFEEGGVMAAYEYSEQDPLHSGERAISAAVPQSSYDLIPRSTQNSLFASGSFQVNPASVVSIEGVYADRQNDTIDFGTEIYGTVKAYGTDAGLDIDLGDGRTASLDVNAAGDQQATAQSSIPLTASGISPGIYADSSLYSVELHGQGPVMHTASGDLRVATGIGVRREGLDTYGILAPEQSWRDVDYGYLELYAPLVSRSAQRIGLNELNFDVAGRYERYSDFGSTENPTFGVEYVPLPELTFKASWGKSFRAPPLYDLHSGDSDNLYPAGLAGGQPGTELLIAGGSNPRLQPETAKSWNTTVEYTPPIHGLAVTMNYFDILYRDRINLPFTNLLTALSDPTLDPFIIHNPSASIQQANISQAYSFFIYPGLQFDPSDVSLLYLDYEQNISTQDVDGVDLLGTYQWVTAWGRWASAANMSWLTFTQRLVTGAPTSVIDGIIFNPPHFKARASLNWTRVRWGATVFVNYVSPEQDNTGAPAVTIKSWTTVDGQVAYRAGGDGEWLGDISISLSAQNLFNMTAPRVGAQSTFPPGVGFDTANASALGRVIGITVSKHW